jgi:hypothetical protein
MSEIKNLVTGTTHKGSPRSYKRWRPRTVALYPPSKSDSQIGEGTYGYIKSASLHDQSKLKPVVSTFRNVFEATAPDGRLVALKKIKRAENEKDGVRQTHAHTPTIATLPTFFFRLNVS